MAPASFVMVGAISVMQGVCFMGPGVKSGPMQTRGIRISLSSLEPWLRS